jgi:hypothetical protein
LTRKSRKTNRLYYIFNFEKKEIINKKIKMTEVAHPACSTNDKIAALTKEADMLKAKLEEERQKLNDVSCK